MAYRCPLCGGELKAGASACASCPLNGGCSLIRCENCGYETVPPRSATVEFLKRLWNRGRRRHAS